MVDAGDHKPTADGPYQLRAHDSVVIRAAFDEAEVRRALPGGFEPAPGCTGGFMTYSAQRGWGITPFSAGFLWIDIAGLDSPTGDPGRCFIAAWFSGKAGEVFTPLNERIRAGGSTCEERNGLFVSTAGPAGRPAFELRVRPTGNAAAPISGTRNYADVDLRGNRRFRSVGFAHDLFEAEPVSVGILQAPEPPQLLLQPTRLVRGLCGGENIFTLGVLTPIEEDLPASEAAIRQLSLFARVGRAAVLVDAEAGVMFMNDIAQAFLGDALAIRRGRLVAAARADDLALRELIRRASDGTDRLALEPVALQRGPGKVPLLVQAIPFPGAGAALGAAPVRSVALLITDPDAATERDPVQALTLLGLTRAEARIAALVGAGLAPKEVARRIGNTEGTVRSTLNQVYGKLGVGRQSELARIVARVETLGV